MHFSSNHPHAFCIPSRTGPGHLNEVECPKDDARPTPQQGNPLISSESSAAHHLDGVDRLVEAPQAHTKCGERPSSSKNEAEEDDELVEDG